MDHSTRPHRGLFCLVFAAVLAGTLGLSAGTPSPAARASESAPTSFSMPPDEELATDAAQTVIDTPAAPPETFDPNPALEALNAALTGLAAEQWDIKALAVTLGSDADRAFAFVRDSIGFDPYAGVLRGAQGTLAARAGNAADRALLLKALLDAMGLTTRFAFGDLDAETGARLLARSFERPVSPLPGGGADAGDQALAEAVAVRAKRDYALLRKALGDGIEAIGPATDGEPLADIAHHVWVQLERDGMWVDLDPSMGDATVGSTLTTAASTADAIPADAHHWVTLRLFAETLEDGTVYETNALEQRLDAATVSNSQILVYFLPDTGGGGLLGGVGLPTAYVPVLSVDDLATKGSPIPVLPGGGLLGGGASEVRLMSLRLEVTTESPGRPPVVSQRILLDRVPPEVRASGSVTGDDLGPMPVVDDRPAVMTSVHHVMVSTGGADPRGALEERGGAMLFAAEQLSAPTVPDRWGLGVVLSPLTTTDDQLVLTSERSIVAGLDQDAQSRTFIGRPRVYLVSIGPDPLDTAGLTVQTDLAVDGVDVVLAPDSPPGLAVQRQLWYGAAQTALETEFVLRAAGSFDPATRRVIGVSLAMGQPLTVLADAAAAPAGAPEALHAALLAGDRVIVPGDPVGASTWWTVATAGGATRSILDPGARAGLGAGIPLLFWGYEPLTPSIHISWDYMRHIRACGGGEESQAVTNCASMQALTSAEIAQRYVILMRRVAQWIALG